MNKYAGLTAVLGNAYFSLAELGKTGSYLYALCMAGTLYGFYWLGRQSKERG